MHAEFVLDPNLQISATYNLEKKNIISEYLAGQLEYFGRRVLFIRKYLFIVEYCTNSLQ